MQGSHPRAVFLIWGSHKVPRSFAEQFDLWKKIRSFSRLHQGKKLKADRQHLQDYQHKSLDFRHTDNQECIQTDRRTVQSTLSFCFTVDKYYHNLVLLHTHMTLLGISLQQAILKLNAMDWSWLYASKCFRSQIWFVGNSLDRHMTLTIT